MIVSSVSVTNFDTLLCTCIHSCLPAAKQNIRTTYSVSVRNTQHPVSRHPVTETHSTLCYDTLSQKHTAPCVTTPCHRNTQNSVPRQSVTETQSTLCHDTLLQKHTVPCATTHNTLCHDTLSQKHTVPCATTPCHRNTQYPVPRQSVTNTQHPVPRQCLTASTSDFRKNPHKNSKFPVMRLPASVRPLSLPAPWTSLLREINGAVSFSPSSPPPPHLPSFSSSSFSSRQCAVSL